MGYLILTYKVGDQSKLRRLALDMLSQRWSQRRVLHAIVTHEHPSFDSAEMRGADWVPQEIMERFHITELCYAYAHDPASVAPSTPFNLKTTAKAIFRP